MRFVVVGVLLGVLMCVVWPERSQAESVAVAACGWAQDWHVGGLVTDLDVDGTMTYLAMGPRVAVVSAALSTRIRLSETLGGAIRDIAVATPYVYAVTTGRGLIVWDSASESRPRVISHPGRKYWAAAAYGDYLYVVDALQDAIIVFSGASAGVPQEIGSVRLVQQADEVVVREGHVYVLGIGLTYMGVGGSELRPEWSALAGLVVRDVAERDDVLLVAADNGLYSAAVGSGIIAPNFEKWYEGAGPATAVASHGRFIYLGVAADGIVVLERERGPAPAFVAQYAIPYPVALSGVKDGTVLVADAYAGLLRLAQGAAELEGLPVGPVMPGYDIVRSDTGLVVAGFRGGMFYEGQDGTAWHHLTTSGPARAVAIEGQRAAVAVMDAGIDLLDFAPADSTWHRVGVVDTPGWAVDVEFRDSYLYVADFRGGLRIIDLADWPVAHEVFASSEDGLTAYDIALAGDSVLVAGGSSGAWRFNVRDNARQPTVSRLTEGGSALSVASGAAGEVYVGMGDGTLLSLAADTGRELTRYGLPGPVQSIDQDYQGRVYVALGDEGFRVLVNAGRGWETVTAVGGSSAWSVLGPTADGETVIMGDSNEGVYAYDAAAPCRIWLPRT